MLGTLAPGTIIDDRYVVLAHLGDGGAGSVVKARELELERTVAIKILHSSLLINEANRARFSREGKVLSRLSHPHILLFYRFGIWRDTYPYIAMEYLEGISLRQLLDQGPLPLARALRICMQICEAMQAAHDEGVVHRDLKPNNVMLLSAPESDFVKVVDFGLARDSEGDQKLTQTGELVGSIFYMSPEQCLGKPADTRSDIYSTGCLLFEAVCGCPPFVADNPMAVIQQHVNDRPGPLVSHSDRLLPAGLESSLLRAMEKDPAERYQSMREFLEDLLLIQLDRGNEIVVAVPAAPSGRSKAKSTRRLYGLLSAGLIGLTVLGCVAFYALRPPGANDEPSMNKAAGSQVVETGDLLEDLDRSRKRFAAASTDKEKERMGEVLERRLLATSDRFFSERHFDDARRVSLEGLELAKKLKVSNLNTEARHLIRLADICRKEAGDDAKSQAFRPLMLERISLLEKAYELLKPGVWIGSSLACRFKLCESYFKLNDPERAMRYFPEILQIIERRDSLSENEEKDVYNGLAHFSRGEWLSNETSNAVYEFVLKLRDLLTRKGCGIRVRVRCLKIADEMLGRLKIDGISKQEYKLRHAKIAAEKEALLKALPSESRQ